MLKSPLISLFQPVLGDAVPQTAVVKGGYIANFWSRKESEDAVPVLRGTGSWHIAVFSTGSVQLRWDEDRPKKRGELEW